MTVLTSAPESKAAVAPAKIECGEAESAMRQAFLTDFGKPEVSKDGDLTAYLFKRQVRGGLELLLIVRTPREDDALALLHRGYQEVDAACWENGVLYRVFMGGKFIQDAI